VDGQIFLNGVFLVFTNYGVNGDDLIIFGDLTNSDRQFAVVTGSTGQALWQGTLSINNIFQLVRFPGTSYFYFVTGSDAQVNLLYSLHPNGTMENLEFKFTIPSNPPTYLERVEDLTKSQKYIKEGIQVPSMFIKSDQDAGLYNIITGWDWVIHGAMDPLLNYSLVPQNYSQSSSIYWVDAGVSIVGLVIGCNEFEPDSQANSWVQAVVFDRSNGKNMGYSKPIQIPGAIEQGSGGAYNIIAPKLLNDGSIGVTLNSGYVAFDPRTLDIIGTGTFSTKYPDYWQAAYSLFTSSGNYLYGNDDNYLFTGSPT